MRAASWLDDEGDELLSTGEAAVMLGASRQHVVDLCDRGELPCLSVGTHRRVRARDVAVLQRRGAGLTDLTRDQRRSLWLHQAVAGKLVADPSRILRIARRNLPKLRSTHPRGQGDRWLREWEQLLDGPVDDVLSALTARSPRAVDLRQNSPFAGVLTERERSRVLRGFYESPPAS
ncbi:MAG: helix-turn-helix domain-containing protein [Acidimicrobiales bacterium]